MHTVRTFHTHCACVSVRAGRATALDRIMQFFASFFARVVVDTFRMDTNPHSHTLQIHRTPDANMHAHAQALQIHTHAHTEL